MLRTGVQLCLKTIAAGLAKPRIESLIQRDSLLLIPQLVRNTSFFNKLTQEQLWKGVVSVSTAGRKRGRGKGGDRRAKRDLNVGKKIGEGQIRVLWPGLNVPVAKQGVTPEIKQHSESNTPTISASVPQALKFKFSRRVHPLDRGWAGRRPGGRKFGPPSPTENETFEGFESVVLEFRVSMQMTATMGRKRKLFCIVAVGNGNGLIGLGSAKAIEGQVAINLAKKRASRRLLSINLIEKHTVNHDFFSQYGHTKVIVLKKPQGYGLKTHRIIKALCELIGITDLYAKVEGALNPKHIMRAFIVGLLRQKTYQEIADENKLHLVEFREESYNFPRVLASPEQCLTLAEARKNPVNFHEYIMGGRHLEEPSANVPFYKKLPGWTTHLKRTLFCRNHNKVKLELLAKYGFYHSHLTKIYPECTGHSKPKKNKEEFTEQ